MLSLHPVAQPFVLLVRIRYVRVTVVTNELYQLIIIKHPPALVLISLPGKLFLQAVGRFGRMTTNVDRLLVELGKLRIRRHITVPVAFLKIGKVLTKIIYIHRIVIIGRVKIENLSGCQVTG